jgi:hypothetical protein
MLEGDVEVELAREERVPHELRGRDLHRGGSPDSGIPRPEFVPGNTVRLVIRYSSVNH